MIEAFHRRYSGDQIRIYRAPGRVNLIGEHTDYNLGFVLPVALELACYVASAPAAEPVLRAFSEHENEAAEWPLEQISQLQPAGRWTDYLIGVAQELARAGFALQPQNLLIRSSVPEGAGLSSSAALEVSCALALLNGRALQPLELAKLCQRAEIRFVGMPCGIMDQYVSVFGQNHAAIRIDCRSQEHEVVELPEPVAILAVNTMVKHALASSAYKERTQECAAAVEMIRRQYPQVATLRDIPPGLLESIAARLPPVIARRARHVVTENERVEAFVRASRRGDLPAMGRLFVESHRSLQNDYEVSCPELDYLVDTAIALEGVYGARMTGGGFGGCTVNLLRPEAVGGFQDRIRLAYHKRFAVEPDMYLCRPSRGAGEVENIENISTA